MTVEQAHMADEKGSGDRSSQYRDAWFAMRLSLLVGVVVFLADCARPTTQLEAL